MEYVLLVVAVAIAGFIALVASAISADAGRHEDIGAGSSGQGELDPYELAYLVEGPHRVVDTAIVVLMNRELIRISRGGRIHRVSGSARTSDDAVEQAVLATASRPGGVRSAQLRRELWRGSAMTGLETRLVAKGLLISDEAAEKRRLDAGVLSGFIVFESALIALLLLIQAIGIVSWSVTSVAAVLVNLLSAIFCIRVRRRHSRLMANTRTPEGQRAVQDARARTAPSSAGREPSARRARRHAHAGVAIGVALYGLGELPDQGIAKEIGRGHEPEKEQASTGPTAGGVEATAGCGGCGGCGGGCGGCGG
ncbi:TIGR04222 domain-containing membrane protein [Planotetraspora mira]|uniref:TIGR04222 domain-containing membrane protein n=1 Tax=Planotetraspora mira TaxID=58121 RepID=A0A8J3XAS1_9ACTN|nr:TIGR04222 domain-containing membrane protein [Planotetraspora mira]GII29793.1 hypothetical protein Pmi06nite_32350 [Planotetraspora mira]